MNQSEKLKIAEALIEIKIVLAAYNNVINNGFGYTADDYGQLSKAFEGVKEISTIIRKS